MPNNIYTLEIPAFFSKDAPLKSILLSLSFGSEFGTGSSPAGSGRAKVDVVNIMRQADNASPHLSAWWASGTPIPLVTIKVSKALGRGFNPVTLVTYSLTDVLITSYRMNDGGIGDRGPAESISFNCDKLVFKAA